MLQRHFHSRAPVIHAGHQPKNKALEAAQRGVRKRNVQNIFA